MQYLGIDFGTVRVGLALGDKDTGVASPWQTLQIPDRARLIQRLAQIVEAEGIETIVVGYPRTLKGVDGHMAHIIDEFVADLREAVSAMIVLEDERLSSRLADRQREHGAVAGRDALAAAIVLETFLARQRRRL